MILIFLWMAATFGKTVYEYVTHSVTLSSLITSGVFTALVLTGCIGLFAMTRGETRRELKRLKAYYEKLLDSENALTAPPSPSPDRVPEIYEKAETPPQAKRRYPW